MGTFVSNVKAYVFGCAWIDVLVVGIVSHV